MSGTLAMFGGAKTLRRQDMGKELTGWPVITEEEHAAVRGVLDGGLFTSNDAGRGEVSALQRDWAAYTGTRYCAAVSNGTAALELALAALDLEPGSEVLVPALTFIGTAIPVVQRLLVPVFVDVDPVTFTMDPQAAAAAVTERTRAIIVVHLHGLPADMTALRALADSRGLKLIEDAAQAQGAEYQGRRAGSIGDVNATSLNVVKNLPTCGEGGLITTDDEELYERIVLRRQFGEDLRAARTATTSRAYWPATRSSARCRPPSPGASWPASTSTTRCAPRTWSPSWTASAGCRGCSPRRSPPTVRTPGTSCGCGSPRRASAIPRSATGRCARCCSGR